MHALEKKHKTNQETRSEGAAKQEQILLTQPNGKVPRTLGNRAVARLLQPSPPSGAQSNSYSRDLAQHITPKPSVSAGLIIQPKLTVNTPGDSYEQEADRISEQIMRTSGPQVQRKCACEGASCSKCGNEGIGQQVQTKRIQGSVSAEMVAPPIVHEALMSRGQPLDSSTREFMESQFGQDFGQVRVHTDAKAAESAQAVRALAYTVGPNVVFGAGQYSPGTSSGRQLLAHELTHAVQQGAARRIERPRGEVGKVVAQKPGVKARNGAKPAHAGSVPSLRVGHGQQVQRKPAKESESAADPLCKDFAFSSKSFTIALKIVALKAKPSDVDRRLSLIRTLKWIWRCATDSQKTVIKEFLGTHLGVKEGPAIWKEAGTPFGGYRGAYPGYYSGKGHLEKLGVSEIVGTEPFEFDLKKGEDQTKFDAGAQAAATKAAPVMAATDLLYFYGHQYAQYNGPGVFANWPQKQFIDFRALQGKGDFSRVKLIVSTSCATCCDEAVATFTKLFPNAVILGFRRSTPKQGDIVRNAFDSAIKGLKKPLLLDQALDVSTVIGVWKSVVKKHFPKEAKSQPAYYQAGTVHYLEMGTWKSMPVTDPANSCTVKGSRIEEAAH